MEPFTGDRPEQSHNPVGRIYYAASTMICTPASLAQEVGAVLDAQTAEEHIRNVVTAAGVTRFRRVAQTPFNLVFEARPSEAPAEHPPVPKELEATIFRQRGCGLHWTAL